MRGKGLHKINHSDLCRITPAYAGKSSRIPRLHLRDRDHPRLCGEKLILRSVKKDKLGSPPPMRGKDEATTPDAKVERITPAYAGKRKHR
mgnify:CR=1 FL=1